MIIDLSADVGEGADDLGIFPLVSSVNVACGAHAGDETTIERCVVEAERLGVAVGAHPGYPDRKGFGRRPMTLSDADLHETLLEQIGILQDMCTRNGVALTHVKPHGALYNQAALDPALAEAVARAVRAAGQNLVLVGLAGSEMLEAARGIGLSVAAEGYADRRYSTDGTLAPRSLEGALIEDPAAAAEQAVAIAMGRSIETLDGSQLTLNVETICLHADTPDALAVAGAIRDALERAGVGVAPLAGR